MATASTPGLDGKRAEAQPEVRRIAEDFDRASRAVRIPRFDRLRYWLRFIALAHRGTQTFSATHDAVYEDGRLLRGYTRALERINRRLEALPPQAEPVQIPVFLASELGPADLALLTRMRIPFVLRGAARHLPAMGWTLEQLEAGWGECVGPINQARDEPSPDLDRPTKAHHYYDFRMGTLAEVAESIRTGGKARFVVAEDIMHVDGGRLREDLDLEHWEAISGWDKNQHHWLRSRLYLGKLFSAQLLVQPEHAYSLWHTEAGDNYFVLTRGRKRWTLAHPTYSAAMRPRVKKTTNYTGSNIDLRESDEVLERRGFRGYLSIPKVQAEIEAGDMLRIPSFWWHTVETLPGSYTLASSLRVESGFSLVAPGLLAMRLLDKQTHAMMRSYEQEGRISDALIGQPRKSRSVAAD
ncbi:MAG: cupin-like domain-containing protein [Planctomycetota bacterium]|nr:cupin-like domain-containing protein [Planctomycetota bacterium]